jgi:hypothetical protein
VAVHAPCSVEIVRRRHRMSPVHPSEPPGYAGRIWASRAGRRCAETLRTAISRLSLLFTSITHRTCTTIFAWRWAACSNPDDSKGPVDESRRAPIGDTG